MEEIFNDYVESGVLNKKLIKEQKQIFAVNYKTFFPENKDALVLDIGIGRGEMLWSMREWGYINYLGIDISPSTVDFCSKAGLNCKMVDNTVKFLNKNKQKYSIITMLDVLEHIPKDQVIDMLTAAGQALTPNGKLIVQTPNMQAPYGYMTRYHDITHEFGVDERSLGQLLNAAGMNNFKCYKYESFIGYAPQVILRRIARRIYQFGTRVCRYINGMLNPKILTSRIFAVAVNSPKIKYILQSPQN